MHALVMGATGFIGANLVRAALAAGHSVRAMVKPGQSAGSVDLPGVERVHGDLKEVPSLVEAMRGMDVVFHAAGPYPVHRFQWTRDVAWALRSAGNVLEACRAAGRPRLVFTSSLTTIGFPEDAPGRALNRQPWGPFPRPSRPATEADPYNYRGCQSPYFQMKLGMEQAFLRAAGEGDPIVVVNPTFCFGPFDDKPARRVIRDVARGRMPVYMNAPINVVDVRDVAEGHLRAAEKGAPGARYILGGENLMFLDVLRTIAAVCGVAPPRVPFPLLGGVGVAYASEIFSRFLLRGPPRFPLVGVELLRYSQHLDSAKARSELGYTTRFPLRQTFEDAVAWLRSTGRL